MDTLTHLPGREIQCDLTFAAGGLPDANGVPRPFPVLVMAASHSRFAAACLLPTRRTDDLIAGMWQLIERDFKAVPDRLVWDREAGVSGSLCVRL